MIQVITPSSTATVSEVKVFGVHQVETEQKRRRRRRRQHRKSSGTNSRINSNDNNHDCCHDDHHDHSDASSTCATVSSESTCGGHEDFLHPGSHHERLDRTTISPNDGQQPERQGQPDPESKKSTRKHQRQTHSCTTPPQEEHLLVSLEEQSRYVALDCEMVGIGRHGCCSSVARVTLVAWDGSILLDELVRQDQEVTDYRTFVSGITRQDLEETATLTLTEVRRHVRELTQDKILVGHALKNDLRGLGITHPWYNVRDTAKYEQFMQVRFDDGVLWPKKLKELAKTRLHRDIQQPGVPHSSYEDALAAMDLYKLVRRKWENAMKYKLNKTKAIEQSKMNQ